MRDNEPKAGDKRTLPAINTKKQLVAFLEDAGACNEALEAIGDFPGSLEQLYYAIDRPDWLHWIAVNRGFKKLSSAAYKKLSSAAYARWRWARPLEAAASRISGDHDGADITRTVIGPDILGPVTQEYVSVCGFESCCMDWRAVWRRGRARHRNRR